MNNPLGPSNENLWTKFVVPENNIFYQINSRGCQLEKFSPIDSQTEIGMEESNILELGFTAVLNIPSQFRDKIESKY